MILSEHGGTCYLTRYSESQGKYVLSVWKESGIKNYELHINKAWNGTVITEIVGSDTPFRDIFKLLSFYEHNSIDHDIAGLGAMIVSKKHVRCLVNKQK